MVVGLVYDVEENILWFINIPWGTASEQENYMYSSLDKYHGQKRCAVAQSNMTESNRRKAVIDIAVKVGATHA